MKNNLKHVIEDIIKSNHLLEDGLFNGYINTTGLALVLQPYVKEKLNDNDVSFDSIKMALFRAGKSIKIPKKTRLFSATNLYIKKEINIANVSGDIDTYREKIREVTKKKDHYLSKILGEVELAIVFDNHYMEAIEQISDESVDIDIMKGLVLIGLSVPQGTQQTPGIMYNISKQLMFFGINIIQVVQTKREFAVIVEQKDMQDTISILSNM